MMTSSPLMRLTRLAATLGLALPALQACTVADRLNIPVPEILNIRKEAPANDKPAGLGPVTRSAFDGQDDDLLTAGLGKSGLMSATLPPFAIANKPTVQELRRRAIYLNYRAALDITEAGGYGRLFGVNLDALDQPTPGEGKIGGVEYLAYDDDGSGQKNVSMLIQIPFNFNFSKPCIVAAPSTGSRGIYGALGVSGEWGLKKGCAVAYTDKGAGAGTHDLTRHLAIDIQGRVIDASTPGRASQFSADLLPHRRTAFAAEHPERYAIKHAHSEQNPERDWGRHVLKSIRFAFWAINEELVKTNDRGIKPVRFQPDNTLVIAASASNGGGAVLRAAEIDTEGLIDGIAVSEPQVQPRAGPSVKIVQGRQQFKSVGLALYDYMTIANLYQPCAAFALTAKGSPGQSFLPGARSQARCDALRRAGFLKADDPQSQANESLAILREQGWLPDSDLLHAAQYALLTPGFTVVNAMSYARASVIDNLCGFSFAAINLSNGRPAMATDTLMANLFSGSAGFAPTAGLTVVNQNAEGGPTLDPVSVSPGTRKQDFNVEGALCLRSLVAEVPGQGTSAVRQRQASDLRRGIGEVLATGNLRGKPAIIVHGRSDAFTPVNHSSRPYFALNQASEGAGSQLRYIEVTNAQHVDAILSNPAFAGMDTHFVPLQPYLLQAMNDMYAHLSAGKALPDSQVVRTVRREGSPGQAKPLERSNVPPYAQEARGANRIVFSEGSLLIAD